MLRTIQNKLVPFAENDVNSLNSVYKYKTARSGVEEDKNDIKTIKKNGIWTKKQKRSYNTILTGLNLARKMNRRVRFLTLTTSDIQKDNQNYDEKKLNDDHRKLKQRIQRMTPLKMLKQGYIKTPGLRKYYPNKKLNEKLEYNYFKVQTNEGNGVLHNLYKGDYLPYNYLLDNWQDIHNSWNVNIKEVKTDKKDNSRVASYVVAQYVSHQDATFVRSSQTWNWIFRGYRKKFQEFLMANLKDWTKQYKKYDGSWNAPFKENVDFKRILERWNSVVYRIVNPLMQMNLQKNIQIYDGV